jgi:hypothetical protein
LDRSRILIGPQSPHRGVREHHDRLPRARAKPRQPGGKGPGRGEAAGVMLRETLWVAVGTAIVVIVLFDVFATVIVPRPVPGTLLLSSYLRSAMWHGWRSAFLAVQPAVRREMLLSFFAPLFILTVLAIWLGALIFGFGCIFNGLALQLRPAADSLGQTMYFAGTTLLTIGYGDIVPVGGGARAVALIAGATGLGTVAIVLAFLFSVVSSYRQRELFLITLDARAGAPPSGVALLEIHAQLGLVGELPGFFNAAQDWCAHVLDTHLAYPVLCYFRSSHVGASWVAALGAVLDAATLALSTLRDVPNGEAQLAHSVGSHVVYDVAKHFHLMQPGSPAVDRAEFEAARERLAAAGFRLDDEQDAWPRFCRLRAEYAASLNRMADYWAIAPAQWIGDRSPLASRPD